MARVLLALLLAGCAAPGTREQIPGAIECSGRVTMSINGGAGPFAGLNGIVTTQCDPGSYVRWGAVPQVSP